MNFMRKRVEARIPTFVTSLQSAVPGTVATFPAGAGGGLLQAGDIMVIMAGANSNGGMPPASMPSGFLQIGYDTQTASFGSDPRQYVCTTTSYKILTSSDVTGGNLTAEIKTPQGNYACQLGVVFRPYGTVTAVGLTAVGQITSLDSATAPVTCSMSQVPYGAQRISLVMVRTIGSITSVTGESGATVTDHTGLTGNNGVAPYGDIQIAWKIGNGDNADFRASIVTNNNLQAFLMAAGMWFTANRNFKEVIDGESLATGLQVCLDAGDNTSVNGTAGRWKDISGNGNDFFLGIAAAVGAEDPTWSGYLNNGPMRSAGGGYALDGLDYFNSVTSLPAWATALSNTNAAWTVYSVAYIPAVGAQNNMFSTFASTATPGMWVGQALSGPNPRMTAYIQGVGAGNFRQVQDTGTVTLPSGWARLAWAVSDVTDIANFMSNGAFTPDMACGFVVPGAASTGIVRINANANATPANLWPGGTRMAMFAVWNRKLTNAELLALDTAIQAERQYGVTPVPVSRGLTLQYLTAVTDHTTATTGSYTFNAPSAGLLIVAGGIRRAASTNVTALTIDGVANPFTAVAGLNASFYTSKVVTVGNHTVVATTAAATAKSSAAGAWLLTGPALGEFAGATVASATATTAAATFDLPGGGVAIYTLCKGVLGAVTWSGATENANVTNSTDFDLHLASKLNAAGFAAANAETATFASAVRTMIGEAFW